MCGAKRGGDSGGREGKGYERQGQGSASGSHYGNRRVNHMETRMVVRTINENAVMAADPGTGVSD